MLRQLLPALALAVAPSLGGAAVLTFSDAQVDVAAGNVGTPVGDVRTFSFALDLVDPVAPGQSVQNPAISTVEYRVQGTLDPGNPSTFGSFNLGSADINPPGVPLSGAQFYGNGASLRFDVLPGADLSDGLQVSELGLLPGLGFPTPPVDATDAVFVLDAREDGTGRYHPPLLLLRADGTGQILNSNNTGDNPADGFPENIEDRGLTFGSEYITAFSFDAASLTLLPAQNPPVGGDVPLPLPGALLLGGLAILGAVRRSRSG